MPKVSEKTKTLQAFNAADASIQFHFYDLRAIIENLGLARVALAYTFQQLEVGYRRILYASIMRTYSTDTALTWQFIDSHDLTRKEFPLLYEKVLGHSLPAAVMDSVKSAQDIQDRITHGKTANDADAWKAVCICLAHAAALNRETQRRAKFRAFGDMRGVIKARVKRLDKNISRLVLKGLGF